MSLDFVGFLAGNTRSTTSVVSCFSFGRIASRNFTHAWYSGDFSWKPISEIKMFKLDFTGVEIFWLWQPTVLSVGDSNENFLYGDCTVFFTSVDAIGFARAFAKVACLVRPDFLVGCFAFLLSGVHFLLTRFGNGTMFSEVDDP